jgi:hypothetical protein
MKYTQKLIKWFVACSVAMVMVANLHAEMSEVTAKIVRIKGSARYTTGGSVWQQLKVGATLHQGAIIQTAADSVVDIVLSEGNPVTAISAGTSPYQGGANYTPTSQQDIVRIYSDTVLAIDRLTVDKTGADKVTDTELDLRAGRMIGDTKKISAASIFEIKIPNGVAGIRGTIWGADSLGIMAVKDGAMGLAYKGSNGPKSVTIEGGFQYDIRSEMMSPLINWDFRDLPRPYFPEYLRNIFFPFPPQEYYLSGKVGFHDQN